MANWRVYEKAGSEAKLVNVGFNWWAFFFPGLWALVKGLPLVGLLAIIVKTAIIMTSNSDETILISLIVFAFLYGFNGNKWVASKLRKNGYTCTINTAEKSLKDDTHDNYEQRVKVEDTVCPKCNYQAEDSKDPLITKYDGLGECPQCGTIPGKYIKYQVKRQAGNNAPDSFQNWKGIKDRWIKDRVKEDVDGIKEKGFRAVFEKYSQAAADFITAKLGREHIDSIRENGFRAVFAKYLQLAADFITKKLGIETEKDFSLPNKHQVSNNAPDSFQNWKEANGKEKTMANSNHRIDALPRGHQLHAYCIERLLGSGAFGITYLAEHRMLKTWHVIKEYLPDCGARELNRSTVSPKSASDKDLFDWGLKCFYEEARMLHKLSHLHIVKVTDLFEANSTAYFVMPYLRGTTLHEWMKKQPNPSQGELEAIFVPLIEGLKYIHDKGLLHRDIKPENIYILENSHPILIDFGSARLAIGQKSKALTQVLTPGFAPWEQYASKGTFTPAMDLYGFAGCMYQAITGELPEEAPNRLDNDEQPRLAGSGYEKRYAGHFLQAIDKSLSVHARDRHQDGFELQKDLVGHEKAPEPPTPALNDSPRQKSGKASPEQTPPQLQNPPSDKERLSDDQPKRTFSKVVSSVSRGKPSEDRTVNTSDQAEAEGQKKRGSTASMNRLLLGLLILGVVCGLWFFMNHGDQVQSPVPATGQKQAFTVEGVNFNMVYIPAGVYLRGSPFDEPGVERVATQHKVRISKGFGMGETEVTQGLWQAVMGNNPSHFKACGSACPVEQVSWNDSQDFIRRLNGLVSRGGFRLPTEAEWEYAVRAGTTTAIYTGQMNIRGQRNSPELDPIAWYSGNSGVVYRGGFDCSDWSEKQYASSRCGTHPVATKQPNSWGLYDMIGNVWEWTADWDGDYPSEFVIDPTGPSSGTSRIIRGCSWSNRAGHCRSAARGGKVTPNSRSGDLGLRLARTH